MAFCELKYFSPALERQTAVSVILPDPPAAGPFFTFYLLHGLSDNHTIWTRRTSIERYVEGKPLIVVMPDTGRGWYTDAAEGERFGTSTGPELVSYIDALFPTVASRSGRCIGGLSMGGYGAINLALQHPELYCSANSHSGALEFAHSTGILDRNASISPEIRRILGDALTGGPNDLFGLATHASPRPALRIDCGTDDFLISENRAFHTHLNEVEYVHEYAEYPGEHTWSYWDEHVTEALDFHFKHLGK